MIPSMNGNEGNRSRGDGNKIHQQLYDYNTSTTEDAIQFEVSHAGTELIFIYRLYFPPRRRWITGYQYDHS